MKYMDFDSGYRDGGEAVKNYDEPSLTLADYKEELEDNIRDYKQGANAVEKQTYRSGYMQGGKDALEELAQREPEPEEEEA